MQSSVSSSPKPGNAGRHRRGRKPASESRATEIRVRLMAWRQTPEAFRSSLRGLAAEIGTSHQLLSFYLRRWDRWQQKEYRRKANEIRACAEAENRDLTQWEEAQVAAYQRASFHSLLDSALSDVLPGWLRERQADAKARRLSRAQLKVLGFLAQRGVPAAQRILQRYSAGAPPIRRRNGGK